MLGNMNIGPSPLKFAGQRRYGQNPNTGKPGETGKKPPQRVQGGDAFKKDERSRAQHADRQARAQHAAQQARAQQAQQQNPAPE